MLWKSFNRHNRSLFLSTKTWNSTGRYSRLHGYARDLRTVHATEVPNAWWYFRCNRIRYTRSRKSLRWEQFYIHNIFYMSRSNSYDKQIIRYLENLFYVPPRSFGAIFSSRYQVKMIFFKLGSFMIHKVIFWESNGEYHIVIVSIIVMIFGVL